MSLETPNAFADEENILLHTALFKQVSPSEAEELLPYLKHAAYDKGDYIFSEGDTDHRMYLLERGRVKLVRTSSVCSYCPSMRPVKCWERFRYSIRMVVPAPRRLWP